MELVVKKGMVRNVDFCKVLETSDKTLYVLKGLDPNFLAGDEVVIHGILVALTEQTICNNKNVLVVLFAERAKGGLPVKGGQAVPLGDVIDAWPWSMGAQRLMDPVDPWPWGLGPMPSIGPGIPPIPGLDRLRWLLFSQPILKVDGVELSILKSNPPQLLIKTKGKTRSADWTEPSLWSSDPHPDIFGIVEFEFRAIPPSNPSAEFETPISTSFNWREFNQYVVHGIRIRAQNNSMTAMLDTGVAEKKPGPDCFLPESMLGKTLVRRGEQEQGDSSIHEKEIERCFPVYVIISPDQPFTIMNYDPNRLRVYTNEKRIVSKVSWG